MTTVVSYILITFPASNVLQLRLVNIMDLAQTNILLMQLPKKRTEKKLMPFIYKNY